MKIGIIGAGIVGKTLGKLIAKANHQVMVSNSRGPQSLFSLPYYFPCEVGSIDEAIDFGEIIILAIPFYAYTSLPKNSSTRNKIIIDVTNFYKERDGSIYNIDENNISSSEIIAKHLNSTHIIKTFNAIKMQDLENNSFLPTSSKKIALPIAGDHLVEKEMVISLLNDLGLETVDIGLLAQGKRFERGTPIYCILHDKESLESYFHK